MEAGWGPGGWGTPGSGVLPECPGALLEVGWPPGMPLAQPAVADVVFVGKWGEMPSLGSHTQCPGSLGSCWPPAPRISGSSAAEEVHIAREIHIAGGAHGLGEPSVSGDTFNLPQLLDLAVARQGEGSLENSCWCLPSSSSECQMQSGWDWAGEELP